MAFHIKIAWVQKPFHIRFKKMDGFIKNYYEIRYLVLLGPGWFDAIYNRIRYLISEKSDITDILIIMLQESELIHIILLYR